MMRNDELGMMNGGIRIGICRTAFTADYGRLSMAYQLTRDGEFL